MKKGERYIFRDQEFWANNGLIYIMDYRDHVKDDDRFAVATRAEFAARAIALNDQARGEKYADERWELNNLVVEMCSAVKDAKRQGDPMDPQAAKQKAYDNRKLIFLNNYNPAQHQRIICPTLATTSYEPEYNPIPQATNPSRIAGADSAPDVTNN